MRKKINSHTLLKSIQLILILTVGTMYSQSNDAKFQDYLSDLNNWEVNTQEQGDNLHVAFEYNKSKENKLRSTHTLPLSELKVENTSAGKTYQLKRKAGDVTFLPNNKFTFTENAEFKKQLESTLSTKAPSGLLLVMAMGDTTVEDVKAVKAQKNDIDLKDLVAVASMGIKADYINSIKALGYEDIKMSNLIAFKSMGIDADWIKKANKENNANLRTSELIMLKKGKTKAKMKAQFKS